MYISTYIVEGKVKRFHYCGVASGGSSKRRHDVLSELGFRTNRPICPILLTHKKTCQGFQRARFDISKAFLVYVDAFKARFG